MYHFSSKNVQNCEARYLHKFEQSVARPRAGPRGHQLIKMAVVNIFFCHAAGLTQVIYGGRKEESPGTIGQNILHP